MTTRTNAGDDVGATPATKGISIFSPNQTLRWIFPRSLAAFMSLEKVRIGFSRGGSSPPGPHQNITL